MIFMIYLGWSRMLLEKLKILFLIGRKFEYSRVIFPYWCQIPKLKSIIEVNIFLLPQPPRMHYFLYFDIKNLSPVASWVSCITYHHGAGKQNGNSAIPKALALKIHL